METYLSETIDIIRNKEKYDTSVKMVLADKQIIARILKYSLEEFSDYDISDIIKNMDEPVVSSVRVEPGATNTEVIKKSSEEDNIPGEGKIYFDIRFSVYHGAEQIKVLINIEAQKNSDSNKLGYQLDNRIIYYLGRMVSAQKEVEFSKSHYDDLKAVRSIWICMDSADDEDSINRIRFVQDTVYGKDMKLNNIDKVQGIIIRLRKNENVEESKNILIAMLEELLKKENIEIKKKKLENYGLEMSNETERRVNLMCNLSDNVFEEGIEAGRAKGREEERIKLIKNLMQSMNIDMNAAMDALKIPEDERETYIQILK